LSLVAKLRAGLRLWLRLGPREGTRAAWQIARALVGVPLRRWRLRWRPAAVTPRDLRRALGAPAAEALASALRALPTVADWRAELDALDADGRAALLARAEDAAAHRFDLLGSGPRELGEPIPWQRDFKAGRTWPLRHISEIVVSYPDGSDIKVPWELSRGQHLPLLAAAHRLTGEPRWLDELGAQLTDWIEANPVEFGPNWQCTMDVAIRAANWVAALALCAGPAAAQPWCEPVLASLLLHGRFIRGHLEWAPVRGNHYLSDVAGLLVVAALFARSREGRRWASWAAAELAAEMEHQVRPDGCDHEASIPYHRLVCELFVCGTQAADALAPGTLSAAYRERLARMLQFVADSTRPDGLAPQVGDADSGRFLPLGDYGADPRDHRHLFRQARVDPPAPRGSVAYPDGGYYVMRADGFFALVRCGDTGLGGLGGHAHNDQLSFELALDGDALVVDPGAYLYTADPAARNAFRSTAFHSTLALAGVEQNEFSAETLFALPDRTRAEALAFTHSDGAASFEGRHHGFTAADPAAVHHRRLAFSGPQRRLEVCDRIALTTARALEWTFPLAPCRAELDGGRVRARFAGAELTIEAEGARLALADGWMSPAYGVRVPTPFVRATTPGRAGENTARFVLSVA
jgi:hypothetical protein